MPAPLVATYSAAALIAAHTAFKNLIDAGAGAGSIKIRSATDVLLAQVPLVMPRRAITALGAGVVLPHELSYGSTGQLVFAIAGPDTSADAGGTAAYAEFCDSAGLVHLAMPAQAGAAAVSGYLVVNTLAVVAGASFEVLSAVLG